MRRLLDQFDVVCREEPLLAVGRHSRPPALVDLLDTRDDVTGIKRQLVVILYSMTTDGVINNVKLTQYL